jgi:hypothetical protein
MVRDRTMSSRSRQNSSRVRQTPMRRPASKIRGKNAETLRGVTPAALQAAIIRPSASIAFTSFARKFRQLAQIAFVAISFFASSPFAFPSERARPIGQHYTLALHP